METKGGCLCGAVRFTAETEREVHACHCSMCRRWSGGPGLAIDARSLRLDDEAALVRFASSAWAERGFCARCGSNLFYHLLEPDQYMLWAGALDDPSALRLAGEIFIDEKPPGWALAGDHPRLTGAEFLASMGAPSG